MEKSMGLCFSMAPLFLVLGVFLLLPRAFAGSAYHDYGQALTQSILFFEAQRSGYLPANQRVKWRGNSGLEDGKASGVNLVGGYYDAGDNVKFGLPMAFTVTMMSWSILEYKNQLSTSYELEHALDAVKWGTDYFIKAHSEPDVLYGEVGDGDTDHFCWQRPEDMSTSRTAYKIDKHNPGSDLAGETAAAMAAASIVFKHRNLSYSEELLEHSRQLFDFANTYRGKYDNSITVAQKYYRSVSGYYDELLWAAAWLYQATNNTEYLNYLVENGHEMGGTSWAMTEFGWDVKYAGVQTLVAKFLMGGIGRNYTVTQVFKGYQEKAEFFMCSCLGKGADNVQKTPGGLIFRQNWNNMQFVTSAAFLTTVYSDYLDSAGKSFTCANGHVSSSDLLDFAKSQVNYILGDNPRATSYMVGYNKTAGYGNNYPQQVHHRAASIVSIKTNSKFVSCSGGYTTWYSSLYSNPNLLAGAIVGGPDVYDNFADKRENFQQTEPATYNNAPLLGVLARLNGGHSGYNQLLPVNVPPPDPKPALLPVVNPPPASSTSPIAISKNVTRKWLLDGIHYCRCSTIITNKSSKNLNALVLYIPNVTSSSLWGLTKSESGYDSYIFPSWINSLAAGKSIEFVFIHSDCEVKVSVSNYTLA